MRSFPVGRTIVAGIILVVIVIGFVVFLFTKSGETPPTTSLKDKSANISPVHIVIGVSVEGRDIDSYTYGVGKTHLIFVGGIHGGYEWNSVVLAYKFLDYFNANTETIPTNLTVTIIPSLNPDGVYKVTGKEGRFTSADVPVGISTAPGRFNANNVDLNRNFDCKWKPESTWQNKIVSGGTKPFSEPEAVAIRNFVLKNSPSAVIFWHSQSGSVYASKCEAGILPETLNIMTTYARASGYSAIETFDSYEANGDSEGWLASIGIPAITVELRTHETIEWDENLAGVKALFEYYKLAQTR